MGSTFASLRCLQFHHHFFWTSNLITVMFFIWHFFFHFFFGGEMAFIFNLRNGFQSWSLRSLNLQNSGYKVMPSKFQKFYWFFPPGNFYCTKSGVGVMPVGSCHMLECSHQSIRHMRLQSIDLSLFQSVSYMRKGAIFVLYSWCSAQCLGLKS